MQDVATENNPSDSLPIIKDIPEHDIIDKICIKGLSLRQAAKELHCTHQSISYRLKKLNIKPNGIRQYKDNRADLLAYYQLQLLKSLTPADIKSMSPAQRVTCFAILYDKERLESNQSTQNIESHQYIIKAQSQLERIDTEISRIERKQSKKKTKSKSKPLLSKGLSK